MYFLTLFFAFILPFQWALSFGGEGVPVARLFGLCLLLWWGASILKESQVFRIHGPSILPLLGFLGWVGVSLSVQPERMADWTHKLAFLIGMYPLILVWQYWFERGYAGRLTQALLWGASLSAVLALGIFSAQFIWGAGKIFAFLTQEGLPFFLGERLAALVTAFPSLLVNIGGATWLRATAVFPDPHVAAYFFGMTAFLALGMYIDTRKKRWLVLVGLLITAHLLTFSRGGYIGLLSGFLLIGFACKKEWRFTVVQGGIIGLIPVFTWLLWPVGERFWSSFLLGDASSLDRFTLWQAAIETIQRFPWFGIGLGQYAEYSLPFQGAVLPYYAHNLYLDIAVESGLVGLGFFLWLLLGAVRAAWLSWCEHQSGAALGAAAALLAYMAHSLFETALFSVHVAVLLSLVMALAFSRKRFQVTDSGLQ